MGTTLSSANEGEVRVESFVCVGSIDLSFRFDGAIAETYAGLVLKGRGGRNGMATENLEARKRVR